MKIEAKNDGKLYTTINIATDDEGPYLLLDTGRLDDYVPYVVIDGMVWHGRVNYRCAKCSEKYWMPLNQTLEDFTEFFRVKDFRIFES